ncbi:DUF2953 domain-containing protein [Paenibacillus mendelii]|uniref:DUF2953 domain-containing protein n=1 Tax=Paenibacillus mendelii TaxID=206163 RepID=A0ABV6JI22_9BACL|nr:DUF2953 domain-containing protein [Paenibacillus mendelii]MCQ6558083.1 DUF2953 domain-containing protein [Paenibacillus mendelii]
MLGYPYGWLIGAGLFFLLVLTALLSSLVISAHVKRIGDDDHAELRVRGLLGIINYHWELPAIRMKGFGIEMKHEKTAENIDDSSRDTSMKNVDKDKILKSFQQTNKLLKETEGLLGWVRVTLGHVRLTEWSWHTAVGTGDAMWTAMLTGMAWSIKTTAIGVLSQLVRLQTNPQQSVQPVYQQTYFMSEWQLKAKIRLGYAILAGFILMRRASNLKGLGRDLLLWQRILLGSKTA